MKPLIVIAGATATGKSDLALDLAKNWIRKSFLPIRCKFINIWILARQKLIWKREKKLRII